ncbi:Peptidase S9A prolyl oligopeptidase protein [Dioscorea alata]|uniref:Peptidase S9A prolyl oligopeptidase protein n=1 Tax=Dioscorea alata TaxID=55571 RepID=A0ACB7WL49_DIOAL|nr:Peptidase S9A prolyl oligopeptidase protein [Dioscorea alata]
MLSSLLFSDVDLLPPHCKSPLFSLSPSLDFSFFLLLFLLLFLQALNIVPFPLVSSQTPAPPRRLLPPYPYMSVPGITPFTGMPNTSNSDLLRYLHQENSYAQALMARTQEFQRTLFAEMKNLMPPNISTPSERCGEWLPLFSFLFIFFV